MKQAIFYLIFDSDRETIYSICKSKIEAQKRKPRLEEKYGLRMFIHSFTEKQLIEAMQGER